MIAGDPSRVYTLSDISKFEEELSRISKNCLRLQSLL
uniref:Transcriptional regulator n=1 Tax=Heterorhabditis bacteriophora TaxID=37862 RepID=A0A1I7WLS4_HETBA